MCKYGILKVKFVHKVMFFNEQVVELLLKFLKSTEIGCREGVAQKKLE